MPVVLETSKRLLSTSSSAAASTASAAMKMRKAPPSNVPPSVNDPTAWLIHGTPADIVLMNTYYIKCMVILAYTFLHGYKLYPTLPSSASKVHRFVSMVLQCTGGGILVPIFINSIPVSLSMDLYPIAIFASFLLHEHFPILRAIVGLSPYFKAALICLYECMRAYVVVKFTGAAAKAIEPSDFSFPVFGPIICGTVAGCGGAFLPLSKGLDPILAGMAQPMRTAFVGAAFYHLFLHTSLSEGVVDPSKKAQVLVAYFFIAHNIYTTFFVDAHGHGHAKSSSAGGGESKKKQ